MFGSGFPVRGEGCFVGTGWLVSTPSCAYSITSVPMSGSGFPSKVMLRKLRRFFERRINSLCSDSHSSKNSCCSRTSCTSHAGASVGSSPPKQRIPHRTNRTQDAQVYAHNGPTGRRTHRYTLTTDQSDDAGDVKDAPTPAGEVAQVDLSFATLFVCTETLRNGDASPSTRSSQRRHRAGVPCSKGLTFYPTLHYTLPALHRNL
eukprot:1181833-Prorocentrum_minimum.AAC.3